LALSPFASAVRFAHSPIGRAGFATLRARPAHGNQAGAAGCRAYRKHPPAEHLPKAFHA
jgi:hypothetical protein